MQASQNKIGSLVDQLLLYCYHYDATVGKYSVVVIKIVLLAGAATVLGIGLLMVVLFRKERRRPEFAGPARESYRGVRS